MKGKKKIIFILLSFIVIAGMLATIFMGAGSLFPGKRDPDAVIIASVKKAPFASNVKVQLTDKGKTEFPNALAYQTYDDKGKPTSAVTKIDSVATMFPAKKAGEKVTVSIIDKSNKEIKKIMVVLEKLN